MTRAELSIVLHNAICQQGCGIHYPKKPVYCKLAADAILAKAEKFPHEGGGNSTIYKPYGELEIKPGTVPVRILIVEEPEPPKPREPWVRNEIRKLIAGLQMISQRLEREGDHYD